MPALSASPSPRWSGAGPQEQPDAAVRRHRRRRRSPTASSTASAATGARASPPRRRQGHARRAADAERHRVGGGRARRRAAPARELVPLSTLLRPPELAAQLRTAGVEHLVLRARVPRPRLRRRPRGDLARARRRDAACCVDALPRLRSITRVGRRSCAATTTTGADRELVAALDAAVRPADDLAIMFTSGSRGTPEGRDPHPRRRARRRPRPASTRGASTAATGSTSRCRSSGWAGSAPACSRRSSPGATLITEAEPGAGAHAAVPRTRAGHAVPRLARPGGRARAATRGSPTPTSSSLRPGSLDAVLPAEPAGRPGTPGESARHDRVVRPVLRLTASTRRSRRARRGAAGGRSPGSRSASSTSTPARRSPPARPARSSCAGPNLMRGICGARRAEVFTDDGFYPTGDLGRLDADGYLFFTGRRDDMFKVNGATVYPSEVEAALHAHPRRAARVRRRHRWRAERRGGRGGRRARRRRAGHRLRRPCTGGRSSGSARSRCRRAGASSAPTTCP